VPLKTTKSTPVITGQTRPVTTSSQRPAGRHSEDSTGAPAEVCKDVENPPTVLSGYVGGSVLLPCYCTELLAEPKTARWSFIEESNVIYPTDQTNHYTDRIKLVAASGNFSLFISGLTKEDGGQYRCRISSDHLIEVKLQVT
ncbi:hypothetical protein P4O66_004146, partial [Electrophorus voltai]